MPAIINGFYLSYLFLLLSLSSAAQEYNYVHYDPRDGLASSTVYDICQDKDGFIWFATDAGLSRFDGTHFKNFTTADGLPESEILKVFADSRGRIWIAPFKNTLCYYYQGKIHTADNDSSLRKITINNHIVDIKENISGDILFLTQDNHILVLTNNHTEIITFSQLSFLPIYTQVNFNKKGFLLQIQDSSFLLQDNRLHFVRKLLPTPLGMTSGAVFEDGSRVLLKLPEGVMTADISNVIATKIHKILFINTVNGTWMQDTLHYGNYMDHFLSGKQMSHCLIDREKNIWFGTIGEGVYKLSSREFRNWQFRKNQSPEILSVEKQNNVILAAARFGCLYLLKDELTVDSINYDRYFPLNGVFFPNRLIAIKKLNKSSLLLGFDGMLVKKDKSGETIRQTPAVKSIEVIDSVNILVATGKNTLLISQKDLTIRDTIWPYRSTAVGFYHDRFYIGTINGLYIVKKDKSNYYPGEHFPALRFRTGSMAKSSDGSLWIATYGAGVVRMTGDRITGNLTMKQGLSSDICRTLFIDGQFLWIGTDKGLNKINITNLAAPVMKYSMADGLPSNLINAIYADSGKVYVGSPAGLTVFDENRVFDYSRCDLQLLEIAVSGKSLPIQPGYTLGYKSNNLKVEFVAISFKSGGDILYRYRLKGLKDGWDSTRQNVLEYPSLPPGAYELELMAINKFGVRSNTITVPVLVEAPFWQTWWFMLLIIALAMVMTAALVSWRFSVLRRREREKTGLQQKINDLEQLALRSQMNPHFIFNCLNSIQTFIINNDLEITNQYLTEFAYLIRQTLDSAQDGTISINKEVKYLSRYIDLEKMRFGQTFDYVIEVDPTIDRDYIHIPSMILQPYVENSIRHGIRYKTDGKGIVQIKFQQHTHQLLCIVEDNGIGREQAATFRSNMHMEYQSRGMSLTAERIKALNRQYQETVTIEITDLTDDQGQATGTRISILFPDKMIFKLS